MIKRGFPPDALPVAELGPGDSPLFRAEAGSDADALVVDAPRLGRVRADGFGVDDFLFPWDERDVLVCTVALECKAADDL